MNSISKEQVLSYHAALTAAPATTGSSLPYGTAGAAMQGCHGQGCTADCTLTGFGFSLELHFFKCFCSWSSYTVLKSKEKGKASHTSYSEISDVRKKKKVFCIYLLFRIKRARNSFPVIFFLVKKVLNNTSECIQCSCCTEAAEEHLRIANNLFRGVWRNRAGTERSSRSQTHN